MAEHADIRVRLTPRAAREQIAAAPDGTYAARVKVVRVEGLDADALRGRLLA